MAQQPSRPPHLGPARPGLAWYEFDVSWILIRVLLRLGIVHSIQVARLDSALAEREAA